MYVQKIFLISAILDHSESFFEYLWHQDREARKANNTAQATTTSFSLFSPDLEKKDSVNTAFCHFVLSITL